MQEKIHFGNFYSNSNAQIFDLLLKRRNRHITLEFFPSQHFFFLLLQESNLKKQHLIEALYEKMLT